MEKQRKFLLSKIRKGKRKNYPDYFVSIKQPDGFSATFSRERNQSISVHYFDGGILTFDPYMVDSYENIKKPDLERLNLMKISIITNEFSQEMPPELNDETHDEIIHLGCILRKCLGIEVDESKNITSYQWFLDLLNNEKDQEFLRHHLATVRYFHGDFDLLKEFILKDTSDKKEASDSFFDEPPDPVQESFFDDVDD